jgi:anti-sigma factor RsiW
MADSETFAEAGHPDSAGWMLGVLEPEESGCFETHLESCPECQQAVAEFGSAAQLLTTALPGIQLADGPEPPPDLQARTLARVQQAAGKTVSKSAGKVAWLRWSPRRTLSAAAAVIAAAAAAIALLLASSAPALAVTISLHPQRGATESGQAVAHHTDNGWI